MVVTCFFGRLGDIGQCDPAERNLRLSGEITGVNAETLPLQPDLHMISAPALQVT
jgi:hypothetical protein